MVRFGCANLEGRAKYICSAAAVGRSSWRSRGRRTDGGRDADGGGVCHRRINWIMTVDTQTDDGRTDGMSVVCRAIMMLDVLRRSKQSYVMGIRARKYEMCIIVYQHTMAVAVV